MSGKPNVTTHRELNQRGSAVEGSQLFTALDQERAASLADEGGAAAVHAEAAENHAHSMRIIQNRPLIERTPLVLRSSTLWTGAAVGFGVGLLSGYWFKSRSA